MKAILRVVKHSNYGSISAMIEHVQRRMEVLNADKSKSHLNTQLLKESYILDLVEPEALNNTRMFNKQGNGLKSLKNYLRKHKEAGTIIQKNSVKTIDHLLTASPEFWKQASEKDKKEFYKSCYKFLADTYGGNNIVSMDLHLDETSPHIHAFVVPVSLGKLKSGREVKRLSAKKYLGGRQKMKELQSNFHSYVKHLGLERGNEKSKAKHTTIKKYYAEINNLEELQKHKEVLEQQLKVLEDKNRGKSKGFKM
jgi:hypothetical protein